MLDDRCIQAAANSSESSGSQQDQLEALQKQVSALNSRQDGSEEELAERASTRAVELMQVKTRACTPPMPAVLRCIRPIADILLL